MDRLGGFAESRRNMMAVYVTGFPALFIFSPHARITGLLSFFFAPPPPPPYTIFLLV
jgi:hypothetical protein